MISAKFSENQCLEPQYMRNNKAKGRKNLRCFPQCRPKGHFAGGYCGRPVHCDVSYDATATKDLELVRCNRVLGVPGAFYPKPP
jgi:hypothetical protein